MSPPTILTLDIETSPLELEGWGLFNQSFGLAQLRQPTRVICWASKWYGQRSVAFASEFHDGRDRMIDRIWHQINAADVVIHYNGSTFDMKHLNREFLEAKLGPPAPAMEIDLLKVVRARFRFASNKLQHVASELGLGSKLGHAGHSLWTKCLQGDPVAWAEMRRYNRQDVRLTERLYDELRQWIPNHPHMGLLAQNNPDACRGCGGTNLQSRGRFYTARASYPRFRCSDCGTWNKGAISIKENNEPR